MSGRNLLGMVEAPPVAANHGRHSVWQAIRPARELSFRTVRPSLLDLRFSGDAWIVAGSDGRAAICLGDYCVSNVNVVSLDLPSLNHLFDMMRHRRPRTRGSKPGIRQQ
jgi:hypothetical protein